MQLEKMNISLVVFIFFRFDDEKFDDKSIHVNGDIHTSDKQLEDAQGKHNNNDHFDSKDAMKDNITRSSSSPYQELRNHNQLKVGNPAEYKNGDHSNGLTFEKSKDNISRDNGKIVNGLEEKQDHQIAPIPTLPTRGILKRAKLANTKNEDKKGV